MTLRNGTTVNPDGSVQLKNKKQLRLKDGECLDMDGNRYETRERFREKMEQRMNRMDREKMKQENTRKGRKN